MKLISDVSKFSWAEIFSDNNGKSSGTAFCGIYIILISGICFLFGCIDKIWITHTTDIVSQSLAFCAIGAGLMGVRKVMNSKTDTTLVTQVESSDGTTK